MRIAVLGTRGIPANYSGFETCVHETALRFAERGNFIRVYCRKGKVGKTPFADPKIIPVFIPFVRGKHAETISHTLFSVIHLAFHPVDVVHLYGAGNGWFVPLLRLFRYRVVFLVDGLDWERAKWSRVAKTFLRYGAKVGSRWAYKTVGDSQQVIRTLKVTLKNGPIEYIPYGAKVIDVAGRGKLASLGLEERSYYLFVGRFVPEKNVHLLIRAFTKSISARKLVLVGGSSYGDAYESSVRSLADNRVLFPGFVFGPEYEELLSGCYVYIQPSALEGTSPSLLAAMGAGACVLVSDIPENKETVADAGFYFRSNDQASLSTMIERLDGSPADVAAARISSVERVEQYYNWDTVAQQLLDLSTIAETHHSSSPSACRL